MKLYAHGNTNQLIVSKKIRYLSLALGISTLFNIGVLSILLHWMLRERLPTPYCDHKPASQQQLAESRKCTEILSTLSQLTFTELIDHLSHKQLIENGYTERDLALAYLTTVHHFDIQRALSKNFQPQKKRPLTWNPKGLMAHKTPVTLDVYPRLEEEQFETLIQFAKTEKWPFTSEGLFLLLQHQKEQNSFNQNLVESFVLTPEFWAVEHLFNRSAQHFNKQEIMTLLLEGPWELLQQFADTQKQLQDSSNSCRQRFLIEYLKMDSPSAAIFLLKSEWDFAVKKLDDSQVIAILRLMPTQLPESERFAKEMLMSPHSTTVWRQASQWLYSKAGESIPKEWDHQVTLTRFISEKFKRKEVAKLKPPVKLLSVKKEPQKTLTKKIQKKSLPMYREYLIQEGDSLWKIARLFGVKVEELRTLNHLKTDALKPGTSLKIPSAKPSLIN